MIFNTVDVGQTLKYFLDDAQPTAMELQDELHITLEDGRVVRMRLEEVFPSRTHYATWQRSHGISNADAEAAIDNLRSRGLMRDE